MKPQSKIVGILFVIMGFIFSTVLVGQQSWTTLEWPVEIKSNSGAIEIYEPQPEILQGNKLTGRAAVSLTPPGSDTPAFGAIWFTAKLVSDMDTRTYELESIDVTRVKFPNSTPDQEQAFSATVERELPKRNLHGSLDALLATLETAQKEEKASENLATAPPKIIFVNHPAVLVLIDGAPKLQAIDGSRLMRVINTPMMMIFHPDTRKYYLSSGNAWYSASEVPGPWRIDRNLPAEVLGMVTDNGQPVVNNLPDSEMPAIIVSQVPAELIVTQGAALYSPIKGTSLLYLSNSENDVLMDISSQYHYVLLAGRWYRSKSLDGPWAYVPADQLPRGLRQGPDQLRQRGYFGQRARHQRVAGHPD